ncbi:MULTISPECIES: hypothetical protein [Pacificimonas]|uniref:Uncharacterized protein n=1 Tax=Pacificimonas aurantium TaxID=1250540 RepID=A0ABS7WQ01_9SPHN|nr:MULTISPECIES: hypothetical protein [Pacificimonas]MBZ6380074.1 hypothetical protein [Pacificimonas aurantium]
MFNEMTNTNVLRSLIGVLGAAALTVTIFYGAAGPDPNADYWAAATVSAGSIAA